MSVKLRIRDEEGKTTVVPMTRDQISVGRKEGQTIRLTERNVSREHAVFKRDGDAVVLEDLSRYGTRVNGERVKEAKRIEPGDVIQIGDYELMLEGEAKAKPVADPAPAKAKKSKRVGGPSGDTAMISLDAMQERMKASGRQRIEADVPMLFCVDGELQGTQYRLTGPEINVGRTPDNDVQVDHKSVSSFHAKLVKESGRYTIYDQDSANGMKINGEFYTQSVLRKGDMVELGHVRLRYIDQGETFVYNPEDYEEGLKAADSVDDIAIPKSGGGGKKAIWIVLLLLVAGGLAAFYFLYWNKPTSSLVNGGDGAAAAAGTNDGAGKTGDKSGAADQGTSGEEAKTAETEGPAGAQGGTEDKGAQGGTEDKGAQGGTEDGGTQAGTNEKAPEAVDPIAEKMAQGEEHLKNERWDEAIGVFSALIKESPGLARANKGLARAKAEKAAQTALEKAQEAVANKDLPAAWKAVSEMTTPPSDSSYNSRYTELHKAVKLSYTKALLAEAEDSYSERRYQAALDAANTVLSDIDEDNSKAKSIKSKALKQIKKARERAERAERNKPRDTKPKDTKPKDTKPKDDKPKDGASASDLYKQGRAAYAGGNMGQAVSLLKQAAGKGYAKAYKLLGTAYMKQGNTVGAISAYKKYLRVRPGASDAEAVKAAIMRLGGTP